MIAVLADDISGAAELAGVALRFGLSAEVHTAFDAPAHADVVCLDTDSRSLTPIAAAATVAEAARRIAAAKPDWVYKKCDSVLRGCVQAEMRAIMDVLGRTEALLVPANPSRGRVIRDGCYFVDDVPLHETVFSRDPEHPRTTSRVVDLVGGPLESIVVPDVCGAADLTAHAALVDAVTLPVGGADFFAALLQRQGCTESVRVRAEASCAADDPTLLVCGSAASWPERCDAAQAQGLPVFTVPHDVDALCGALTRVGSALIGIGQGSGTVGQTPAGLVRSLADVVTRVVRTVDVAHLLLEGGATAAATVRALGWSRLRACEGSVAGVGVLTPLGASGTRVFIKPGSYPWPVELWPGLWKTLSG